MIEIAVMDQSNCGDCNRAGLFSSSDDTSEAAWGMKTSDAVQRCAAARAFQLWWKSLFAALLLRASLQIMSVECLQQRSLAYRVLLVLSFFHLLLFFVGFEGLRGSSHLKVIIVSSYTRGSQRCPAVSQLLACVWVYTLCTQSHIFFFKTETSVRKWPRAVVLLIKTV